MSTKDLIATLYSDDIIPFKHEGKYAWVTLIGTKGTYLGPRGGELCMRVVNSPKGFTRSMLANFQDIFYLDTIIKIVELGRKNKLNEACLSSSKIYFQRFPTPMCFIENVKPFGVTAISCLEDYKKFSPVTAMPTQIQGMLGHSNDPSNDDTFKISDHLIVVDTDLKTWDQTRLNVFLTLNDQYIFKIVITKRYELKDWLDTQEGDALLMEGSVRYIAYIRLGYTHDRQQEKRQLYQNSQQLWCLKNLVFNPEQEWSLVFKEFSLPCLHITSALSHRLSIIEQFEPLMEFYFLSLLQLFHNIG